LCSTPYAFSTYLIHIDPKSVNVRTVDTIEKVHELLIPILLRVLLEPVREVRRTGPHYSLVVGTVCLFQESVVTETFVERRVGFRVVDCGVYHNNVVLISGVYGVHEVFHQMGWEPLRVESEDSAAVHVVDY
jgi:hypothetical protein